MARSSWSCSSDLISGTGVVLRPKLGAGTGESPTHAARLDVRDGAPVSAAIYEGGKTRRIGSRTSTWRLRMGRRIALQHAALHTSLTG
jgi:hypothetical protein